MAKLLHIFYHKEGTFSLLCQQVQLITVSWLSQERETARPLTSKHVIQGYSI